MARRFPSEDRRVVFLALTNEGKASTPTFIGACRHTTRPSPGPSEPPSGPPPSRSWTTATLRFSPGSMFSCSSRPTRCWAPEIRRWSSPPPQGCRRARAPAPLVIDAASAPVVDQDQDFLLVDVEGAARADVDHQWAPESLDFHAGTTRQEFGATLIDDTPGQPDKPSTINLRQFAGDDHLVRGPPNMW